MDAEVIAFGDELTSGQRIDTNSAWLSRQLSDLGIRVAFHTTAGDDLADSTTALRRAIERAHVVLTSGGLGPTADDLTRDALAAAAQRPLERRADVQAHIERLFARRGRVMAPQNRRQAEFPAGSRVVPNPQGTAPGIHLELPRPDGSSVQVFALPGVPTEMRQMWTETVRPALLALPGLGTRCVRRREIHCFGAGESEIERLLPDLVRRGRHPTVGITAHEATITLRLTAVDETATRCQATLDRVSKLIHDCLGNLVFGCNGDQLQDAVVRLLIERQLTLAAIEWGTAGLATRWLAEADRSQAAFSGGLVIGNEPSCRHLLSAGESPPPGVPLAPAETVRRAAVNARQLLPADWLLAIGPLPPPSETEAADDVGQAVHVVLATPDGLRQRALPFVGHPGIRLPRIAKQALDLVRLTLLGDRSPS